MGKANVVDIMRTIQKINNIFLKKYKRDPFLYYMNGHCYYYAKMLQQIYKQGKLYYNESHVVFKINDFYYDVKGIVQPNNNEYIQIENEEHEAFVRMILAPSNSNPDLEINNYIIGQIKNMRYQEQTTNKKTR